MSKDSPDQIAKALALIGCGCDADAREGCVNFNGDQCTFQETVIASNLKRERAEGLREARELLFSRPIGKSCSFAKLDAWDAQIEHRIANLTNNVPGDAG